MLGVQIHVSGPVGCLDEILKTITSALEARKAIVTLVDPYPSAEEQKSNIKEYEEKYGARSLNDFEIKVVANHQVWGG